MSDKTSYKSYWVGDPCYVLSSENGFDWGNILTFTGLFGLYDLTLDLDERVANPNPKEKQNGIFTIYGQEIAVSSTAYGDGHYYDQYDNGYGVDAGCLSCIPLDLLTADFDGKDSGCIHTVPDDQALNVFYTDGVISFLDGQVIIDTDDYDCD